MFIPIGDDIQKRMFPAIGVFLIVANVLVHVHTMKLWEESIPKEITVKTMRDFDITKTTWYRFTARWGLVPADVAKGKTIGLATHMFLHGDLLHLIGNMIVLWAFVGTLENSLGALKFLAFYLLWGLLAGLSHLAGAWGDSLPMIGASGAVAGMIGGYFVLFGALSKIRTIIFIPKPIKVNFPAGLYVMIWLAFQFLGMEESSNNGGPHVAYYAHLGGALAGAASMYFYRGAVHARMKLNQQGQLEFKDEPPPLIAADAGADGAVPVAARVFRPKRTTCPHCGTILQDGHRVAERLWRCPSYSCQRLVY
jgi:membrane associated rhomboid family serine protease